MISKLKKWYTLEMYQGEEDNRKARIILFPILMFWGLSLLSLLLNLSWGDPTLAKFLIVGCLLQLIPLWLLLRKKILTSSYVIVLICISFATLFAMTGQGIHDYILMIYPVVMIWAGLSSGRRALFFATFLTLISFAWLALGQGYGWFVIQPILSSDWTDVFIASLLAIVSALAVNLWVTDLENALVSARAELTDRKNTESRNRIIAEVQDFLLHPCEMREIYSLVSEKTRDFIGDGITATAILDENRYILRMGSYHGLDIPFDKILKVLGFDPWTQEFPLDVKADEDLSIYNKSTLGVVEGGLYSLLTRSVPKEACQIIETLLGVQKIYGMGFVHKNAHLGGLVILARGDISPYIATIEQIVNLATIAIERKRAEQALQIAEADLREAFENTPIGIFQSTVQGRYRRVNPSMARMYGYDSPEDMLASITEISTQIYVKPADRQRFQAALAEHGEVLDFIGENYRKDGSIFWTQTSARLIKDSQGNPLWYEGFISDVTQRWLAERAASERNAELAVLNQIGQRMNKLARPEEILESVFEEVGRILDNRNTYITLYDKENQYISFQVYMEDGVRLEGLGRPLSNGVTDYIIRNNVPILAVHDMPEVRARLGIVSRGKPARSFLGVPIRKEDEVIGVIAIQDYEHDYAYNENHLGLLTTIAAQVSSALENARLFREVQDELEERKRAEEALKQSEKNYRELFEVNKDGIAIFGIGPYGIPTRFVELNTAAHAMLGYTREEMLQFTPQQLEPDVPPDIAQKRQHDLETRGISTFDTVLKHKSGTQVFVEMTAQFIQYEGQIAVMNITRDISERKQAEIALRESELRFRSIIENAPIAITLGRDGKLLYANPVYVSMHGFDSADEVVGRPTLERIAPQYHAESLQRQQQRARNDFSGQSPYELTGLRKDGTQIQLLLAVSRVNLADGPANIGFIQDITARKQAEEALRKSEAKFRAVVEQSNDGILFGDAKAKILYRSPSYNRINGFTDEERLGRSGFETVHPDDIAMLKRWWADIVANPSLTPKVEYRIKHKDGYWLWLESSAQNMLGNPDIEAIVVISRDITDRKQAEVALHESEERYRGAITAAGLVPYVIDYVNGQFTFLGENIYKLTGYPADEFTPAILRDSVLENKALDAENLELTLDQLQVKFRSGEVGHWGSDMRIRTRSGQERWISDVSLPLQKQDGIVTSAIGVFQDLTERKLAEEALKQSEEKFKTLIEKIIVGVYIIQDASLVYINPSMASMFGYTQEEIVGHLTPEDLFHPDDLQDVMSNLQENLAGNTQKGNNAYKAMRKDGSIIFIEAYGMRIDFLGRPAVMGTLIDVTERNQTEAELHRYREHLEDLVKERTLELEDARDLAEAANRAKSDFLAVMSHEIRTPLNGVLGNAQLLGQSSLSEKQRGYLANLQVSGQSLLAVISDILDFSKIESGRLQLEETSFSLDEELGRLSGNLASRAGEKKLELVFNTAPEIPDQLVGDPARLGQILLNLVGNAIKFTEAGSVVVTTKLLEQNTSRVLLEFSIKDTGIGLTGEQLGQLFKPFTQADSSTTRKYGGTGLGLSISQRLVQVMGGSIHVESRLEVGSTFTFVIPLALQPGEVDGSLTSSPKKVHPRLAGLNVLVVSKQPDTLIAIRGILEYQSSKVSLANSVEAALEQLAETGTGLPFDMVLMDWNLSVGSSGFEAMRSLKHSAGKNTMPVVLLVDAVEASYLAENEQVDGIVVKPFTRVQLLGALEEVLEVGKALPGAGSQKSRSRFLHLNPPTTPQPFENGIPAEVLAKLRGGHILLVEDNQINRLVASEILLNMGMRVVIASDGEGALEKIRDSFTGGETKRFDAVLMDIQMPGIDGYEATRRIRLEKSGSLPVIAMTANAMKGDRKKALDSGMDDYISKPVSVSQLAMVLMKWVKPHPVVQSMDPPLQLQPKSPIIELPSTLAGLDTAGALVRLGNNRQLYQQLLLVFNLDHANDVKKIRAAFQANNTEHARQLVHTLKGVAATLGAEELREAARDLETAIIAQDFLEREPRLARLDQKLAVVIASIADLG